jgi:hypothetical protein
VVSLGPYIYDLLLTHFVNADLALLELLLCWEKTVF